MPLFSLSFTYDCFCLYICFLMFNFANLINNNQALLFVRENGKLLCFPKSTFFSLLNDEKKVAYPPCFVAPCFSFEGYERYK